MSDDAAAVEESDPKDEATAETDTAAEETSTDNNDTETEPADGTPENSDGEATEEGEEKAASPEETAESGESTDVGSASVDDLVDRIVEADESVAPEATELRQRIESLETERAEQDDEIEEKDEEIDELTEKLSRARADFKNYKKRTKKQQEQLKERATEDLVERLTKVRDNLLRALDQDEDADIRPGVESTLESFDRVLDEENVSFISPDAGSEVDPERHEVMQRVDSDQPEGTIVDVYQPGYEMADTVLRPARITVSSDD